jgi:hypothetical protein
MPALTPPGPTPRFPQDGDIRFTTALYTLAEAARAVDVPAVTFARWARGLPGTGVTVLPTDGLGQASVPFVGLVEGLVLSAVRRAGVPSPRIHPALLALTGAIGVGHPLASRALVDDGPWALHAYAEQAPEQEAAAARALLVLRQGEPVFVDLVQQYLSRIEYGSDGYARVLRLPAYERAEVLADPQRSFGQPMFALGGARVRRAGALLGGGGSGNGLRGVWCTGRRARRRPPGRIPTACLIACGP